MSAIASLLLPSTNLPVVIRLILSVCLSVCPVHALAFEILDLETIICSYIFRIPRSSSCQGHWIKVTGTKNGINQCNEIHTFAGGPSSVKSKIVFVLFSPLIS